MTELAPLRSAFFTINFAKVTELKPLFESEGGAGGEGESGGASGTLLSPRGSVIIDERTNTLILKDTEEVISEVRRILTKLDVPIRQVMISSRIVIANDDFTRELGNRFGVTRATTYSNGEGFATTSGTSRLRLTPSLAVHSIISALPVIHFQSTYPLVTSTASMSTWPPRVQQQAVSPSLC